MFLWESLPLRWIHLRRRIIEESSKTMDVEVIRRLKNDFEEVKNLLQNASANKFACEKKKKKFYQGLCKMEKLLQSRNEEGHENHNSELKEMQDICEYLRKLVDDEYRSYSDDVLNQYFSPSVTTSFGIKEESSSDDPLQKESSTVSTSSVSKPQDSNEKQPSSSSTSETISPVGYPQHPQSTQLPITQYFEQNLPQYPLQNFSQNFLSYPPQILPLNPSQIFLPNLQIFLPNPQNLLPNSPQIFPLYFPQYSPLSEFYPADTPNIQMVPNVPEYSLTVQQSSRTFSEKIYFVVLINPKTFECKCDDKKCSLRLYSKEGSIASISSDLVEEETSYVNINLSFGHLSIDFEAKVGFWKMNTVAIGRLQIKKMLQKLFVEICPT